MPKFVKPNVAANTLGVCRSVPSDDGRQKAKSTRSKRRLVKDGTTSKNSSNKNPLTEEDAPLLSRLASLPDLKLKTCIDKLSDYQRSTLVQKLLKKWQEDLILGGKACSPFWDEFSKEISKLLWLPTKTDSLGLGSTLSSGYANSSTAKSWYSNLDNLSPHQELVADIIAILHSFSSRLYSLRKHAPKIQELIQEGTETQEEKIGSKQDTEDSHLS